MTENWFKFSAYNTQVQYGYGTDDEAVEYLANLNKNREINCYAITTLSAEKAAELRLDEGMEDGFNLDDELASISGIR